MSTKKAVATQVDNFPTTRPEWMGNTNRGNEGVSSEDMTIPRISIIQDLSPQHKKSKPEYIEGASTKMAFNTATQQLYGESLHVVPVLFRKEYVIWKDIEKGGGFRGAFPSMDAARKELAEMDDAGDCEIQDTHQHFVLVVEEGSTLENPITHQAVISMSKSQCKPSRQWNTMIQNSGGDRWERMYDLNVVDAQNAAGQDYYNWQVKQNGYVSQAMFDEAEKLYEAVRSGAMDVKRDEEPTPKAHSEGDTSADAEF